MVDIALRTPGARVTEDRLERHLAQHARLARRHLADDRLRTVRSGRTVPTSVQTGRWRMRALLWTIAALIAVLVFITAKGVWPVLYRYSGWLLLGAVPVLLGLGMIAWLYDGAPHVQVGRPILLGRTIGTTAQHRPQPESTPETPEHLLRDWIGFRVRDRVFHTTFGHGTVIATDGPKLTIEFDHGGVKRVIDSFVVRSEDPRPPD
jgi:hypothetical protein